MRLQVRRSFWLRRRSAWSQSRITLLRKPCRASLALQRASAEFESDSGDRCEHREQKDDVQREWGRRVDERPDGPHADRNTRNVTNAVQRMSKPPPPSPAGNLRWPGGIAGTSRVRRVRVRLSAAGGRAA